MANIWQYYLLIIIVFLQGLFCRRNNTRVFLVITFVELFFISGFRNWNIGNDTLNYVNTFIATISSLDLSRSHMEHGYLLFNKFLSLFTNSPQAILIVSSFFILGITFYFIHKYSEFVLLSILLDQ